MVTFGTGGRGNIAFIDGGSGDVDDGSAIIGDFGSAGGGLISAVFFCSGPTAWSCGAGSDTLVSGALSSEPEFFFYSSVDDFVGSDPDLRFWASTALPWLALFFLA